jgi:hypothetical protein
VQKMRKTEVSHNTLSFLLRGQCQHAQMPEVGTCASPAADDMLQMCAKACLARRAQCYRLHSSVRRIWQARVIRSTGASPQMQCRQLYLLQRAKVCIDMSRELSEILRQKQTSYDRRVRLCDPPTQISSEMRACKR